MEILPGCHAGTAEAVRQGVCGTTLVEEIALSMLDPAEGCGSGAGRGSTSPWMRPSGAHLRRVAAGKFEPRPPRLLVASTT